MHGTISVVRLDLRPREKAKSQKKRIFSKEHRLSYEQLKFQIVNLMECTWCSLQYSHTGTAETMKALP